MSDAFRTSIDIEAPPDRVFDHFVQPELLVRWMGDFARLEAIDGGVFSVDIEARGALTRVELQHTGLAPSEAVKHAVGWPHFIERLGIAAAGGDPGADPWKNSPP